MKAARIPSKLIRGSLSRALSYVQGQSPAPKKREYFYFIDHQGQLYLDDAKVKNFITCFKDKKFLAFFFRRLKVNTTGRYQREFPFVSPCGPETNYIHCDDLPIVYTHLLDQNGHTIEDIASYGRTLHHDNRQLSMLDNSSAGLKTSISHTLQAQYGSDNGIKMDFNEKLSYGGAGNALTLNFQPEKLCMLPESGRVYHTGPDHLGGVGLVKSSLAIELSRFFVYSEGGSENDPPVQFVWRGRTYELDNEVLETSRSRTVTS